MGVKKACVVDDSTDAGIGGGVDAVRQTLGAIADPACNISVKKGDKDFSAAVTQIKGQSPDAVVYASYYTEAALLQQRATPGSPDCSLGRTESRTPDLSRRRGRPPRERCHPARAARRPEPSSMSTPPLLGNRRVLTASRPTTPPRSCAVSTPSGHPSGAARLCRHL